MRIEVLDEAGQDLLDGFRFCESQSEGLGDYFVDSVTADIESLRLLRGHPRGLLRLPPITDQAVPVRGVLSS